MSEDSISGDGSFDFEGVTQVNIGKKVSQVTLVVKTITKAHKLI